MQTRTGSFTRESFGIALQLLILAISLGVGLNSYLESRTAQHRQRFLDEARQSVQDLAVATDPDLYLQRHLLPLLRPFRPAVIQRLPEHLRRLETERSLAVRLYRFDRFGGLAETIPAGAPLQKLMTRLFRGLVATDSEELLALRKDLEKQSKFAFGDGRDLSFFRRFPGQITDVYARSEKGFLAWNRHRSGGVILYGEKLPDQGAIFRATVQGGAGKDCIRLGYGGPQGQIFGPDGRPCPIASAALAALRASGQFEGEQNGVWWTLLDTVGGQSVYASFPIPHPPLERWRQAANLAAGIFAVVAVWAIFLRGVTLSIRLRWILLGLFLASSLIPLGSITLGSFDLAEGYRTVQDANIRGVQEELLHNVVQGFQGFLASFSTRLNETLTGAIPTDTPDDRQLLLERIGFPNLKPSLCLRDTAGDLLFLSAPLSAMQAEEMLRGMARRGVERYAPERLAEKPYRADPIADSMVRRDDMGFSTMLSHPRKLQVLQSGNRRLLVYIQILRDPRYQAAYLEVYFSHPQAVRQYLQDCSRRRTTFQGVWLRLFALDTATSRWTLPPPPDLRQELHRMAQGSWVTGRQLVRRINRGRNSGLAVGIPCPELADHCLIAFFPEATLQEGITRLWQRIIFGAILFLALVAMMGWAISRQFLDPLKHLERGVEALRRREFEMTLPVAGNDELANLSLAFNVMMEESRDLILARNVQEGLIPAHFPDLPGYRVAGRLFTASDLGGDCLDCFTLPDGRMVFLVGDITGHGVGSALIMAFARAITFLWSNSSALTPEALASDLDQMLRRRRKSRLFMGVVCGILDPATHQLDVVVRGQVFPLLLHPDGTHEWIGQGVFPLGIGRKAQAITSLRLLLEPDARLVCLTDGFVEALDPLGQPVGYERLVSWAKEESATKEDRPIEEWMAGLLDRQGKWCHNHREDDLTIFCIHRRKGEDGP